MGFLISILVLMLASLRGGGVLIWLYLASQMSLFLTNFKMGNRNLSY